MISVFVTSPGQIVSKPTSHSFTLSNLKTSDHSVDVVIRIAFFVIFVGDCFCCCINTQLSGDKPCLLAPQVASGTLASLGATTEQQM